MTARENAVLRARAMIVIGLVAIVVAVAWSARPHAETPAERVDRITSGLRCVVCQGLSVKDSPAESARQMRDLVVQRVAEGRSDREIVDEFRASYGDWVVLEPPLLSWSALVWLVPVAALLVGGAVAWRGMRTPPPQPPEAPPADVAALRERVAREEALDLPSTETP
ncbi:MAG TPA: cytochrome c-type biogenesis protein [Candidatus Limnocylindria bacterium]|nr:cytochrome c-type biogenesis protein [Candidatus Limnocylindria bacterium]